MEKLPSWVWIAGGALIIVVLMMGSSGSGAAVQTIAPAPTPDTSALDVATTQGKFGLASSLVNAAGTLDVYAQQGATQAQHDNAILSQLNATNAGNVAAINASGYANSFLATIGANRDIAVSGIAARNNLNLAREETKRTAIGATRDITTNQSNNDTTAVVAGINANYAAGRDALAAQTQQTAYRYADAAQERQTNLERHRSTNDMVGNIVGNVIGGIAHVITFGLF